MMENKNEDRISAGQDQSLEPETELLNAEPETEMLNAEPETEVTELCGAPMTAEQAFCTSCGAARAAAPKKRCSKCGMELSEGQDFCPNCGQKAGLEIDAGVADAISRFNSGVNAANEAKKKQPKKLIIAIVAAIAIIAAAIIAIPKLFQSVESLCEQGRYAEAYEKADGDEEKLAVRVESIAAQSMLDIKGMLDGYSYDVKKAYLREGTNDSGSEFHDLALKVEIFKEGSSIGDGYIAYVWDDDEQRWECWGVVFSLEHEDYGRYDSTSEKNEKLNRNLVRAVYNMATKEGTPLSSTGLARVNSIIASDVTIDPVAIAYAVED